MIYIIPDGIISTSSITVYRLYILLDLEDKSQILFGDLAGFRYKIIFWANNTLHTIK
jgi:hypothetical protein